MADCIRIVNLNYPQVKKLYALYSRAKKTNSVEAERCAKQLVTEMQNVSRLGQEVTFPDSMRHWFERLCEKFDKDTYVVDDSLLQKVIDAAKGASDA